jgi:kinesin family protein 18/19
MARSLMIPNPFLGQKTERALSGGGRKFAEELETVREDAVGGGVGTRIMVYVRLRPMSKKEKESGSRSCVRVVNKRDVYLTEFALETDYLRLKRLRGRHFAFDAAFPDSTAQQEVYNIR